ncbi:MAG: ABC transporter permease, partial [Hydrogeniiclostridium sp.]
MRVKAFHKDVLRAVTHSWSRFLALFVIVALGAGFYSGLRTTALNMRATADAYYDDTRFFDVRLVSTFGFTDDDVEAIRATEGVESVMAGYSADWLVRMGEKDVVTRLHSLPSDLSEDNEEYLNRPTLKEGRMPENPGECVVSVGGADDATGLAIGDTVTVEDTDGSLGDTLARSEFTVVGFVESSYYLSMSLGTSTVGSGTLGRYLYVLEDDFSQEYYTDLYLSVEGSRELDTFSGAYEELVQPVLDSLEDLAGVRAEIRYGEIRDEAEETLADAEQTYEEEKAKAEKELDDAYQELLDGEQELEDAEQELLDGEQELEDAKRELEDARTELADGRQELVDGQAEYEDGVRQLEEGKADYEDGVRKLEEAKDEWSDGWSEYLTGLNEYEHN